MLFDINRDFCVYSDSSLNICTSEIPIALVENTSKM